MIFTKRLKTKDFYTEISNVSSLYSHAYFYIILSA